MAVQGMTGSVSGALSALVRSIPDYPKPGITFRDVTTLFADARGLSLAVDALVAPFRGADIQMVAGIEARGFILGGAVAHALGVGFVPIRKKGKLPRATHSAEYALEYGVDTIEIHIDAVASGTRILLVDDLIATGGTAQAALDLITRCGGVCVASAFLIDLPALGGSARLEAGGQSVHRLMTF